LPRFAPGRSGAGRKKWKDALTPIVQLCAQEAFMGQGSGMTDRHDGEITQADVIPAQRYGRMRTALRKVNAETSRLRRIAMGPKASIYFENWDTIWFQLHEMLFIVDRDEMEIDEELRAFSMLVPRGQELVATVALENDETGGRTPRRNKGELRVSMTFAGETIVGTFETDSESCASAQAPIVHFIRFEFTPRQVAKFCMPGTRIVLRIEHPACDQVALMPEQTRRLIRRDLNVLEKSRGIASRIAAYPGRSPADLD
jgi:hypothetical protein